MDKVTSIIHPADKYLVPTHIKLGYRTLIIEPKLMDDFGEYVNNENKILYNSKQTPPELVNTIIHELMHAIYYQYNLSMQSSEEDIVNAMANGMTELLTRTDLLQFIKHKLKEV